MKKSGGTFLARFLLCEDVRAEAFAKLSFIGVYIGERIIVFPPQGPKPKDMKGVAQLGPLSFVVIVSGRHGKFKTGFELIDPNGKRWGTKLMGKIEIKPNASSILATRVLQMLVPKYGEYLVRFSMNGTRFDFPFHITPAPKGAKLPGALSNQAISP